MEFLAGHTWILTIGMAGFVLLWPISLIRRDASIVDFWWGPGFGVMAVALWWMLGRPDDGRTLAIMVPLVFWAMRLGVHLGLRRLKEGHEDPRYQELRAAWSPGWEWKSLIVVFGLQGVLQAMIGLGVLNGIAHAGSVAPTGLTFALAGVAIVAAMLQMISDFQLDAFRARESEGRLMTGGLRSVVRYPSYSAEILFWTALSLIALGAGVWWAPVSALLITGLLRYVSGVAILEERLSRTRPEFAAYRERVPALIPRLPTRRGTSDAGQRKTAD